MLVISILSCSLPAVNFCTFYPGRTPISGMGKLSSQWDVWNTHKSVMGRIRPKSKFNCCLIEVLLAALFL